jgi:hypothetical protein
LRELFFLFFFFNSKRGSFIGYGLPRLKAFYSVHFYVGKDPLIIGYFINFDNELSNKYEKILKIEKKIIDVFF